MVIAWLVALCSRGGRDDDHMPERQQRLAQTSQAARVHAVVVREQKDGPVAHDTANAPRRLHRIAAGAEKVGRGDWIRTSDP